jgi:hypothetical protein
VSHATKEKLAEFAAPFEIVPGSTLDRIRQNLAQTAKAFGPLPNSKLGTAESPVAEAAARLQQTKREADAAAIAEALSRRLAETLSPPAAEPPKTSKGPAPATLAWFRAVLFYERHVGIKEPIAYSRLALDVQGYATKNNLPGADLLRPGNANAQVWAREALETLRHPTSPD